MKSIRTFGLGLLLAAFAVFISILFVGQYKLSSKALDAFCVQKNITSPIFINTLESSVIEREFNTPFYLANTIAKSVKHMQGGVTCSFERSSST